MTSLELRKIFIIQCSVLLCLFIRSCLTHPQCLDFRAPFYAESPLNFCPEYTKFGCCTGKSDGDLQTDYSRLRTILSADTWTKCGSYIKELLCTKCSPYAAHIYDGESTLRPRSFPGLCRSYCENFYTQCRDVIQHLAVNDTDLIQSVSLGVDSFCSKVQLLDVDYCYPELKTNDILNNRIKLVQVTKEGCLCVQKIADKLHNPVFARHPGDDSGRLFVGEVTGKIFVYYLDGSRERRPFLDLQDVTLNTANKGDERGLLGLAFHPKFAQNGKFYIYYSTTITHPSRYPPADHKVRVSEFLISPFNKNKADKWSEKVILDIEEPFWNHNGGEILFGDDGYLYVFVGDGGSAGDPFGNAQNTSSLLGKVLRIDVNVDRKYAYAIPNDNPFLRDPSFRPEIYAYGVRNIWRCGKDKGDPVTGEGKGRILCGDVGQSAYEEIDLLKKGANYGWNAKEGFACYNEEICGSIVDEELPVFSYPHYVGKSVTGGHFYRGCASPNLNGFYIYGDYMTGKLYRLLYDKATNIWNNKEINMCGSDLCTPPLSNNYAVPHIMSFGEDEFGEIYMLSTSNSSSAAPEGSIYKIVDPARRGNPATCKSAGVTLPSTGGIKIRGTTPFEGINRGNPGTSRRPGGKSKGRRRNKKTGRPRSRKRKNQGSKNKERRNLNKTKTADQQSPEKNTSTAPAQKSQSTQQKTHKSENNEEKRTNQKKGENLEKYFLKLESIRIRMCRRRPKNRLCRYSRIYF